jgi:hypothetical protein
MCIDRLSRLSFLPQGRPIDLASQERREALIDANTRLFSALAWYGFGRLGRGALVVGDASFGDNQLDPDKQGITTYYSPPAELALLGLMDDPGFADRLNSYLPELEFMLALVRKDGSQVKINWNKVTPNALLDIPPYAFREQATAQPKMRDEGYLPGTIIDCLSYLRLCDFADTPDGRFKMIVRHATLFAAAAWAGYIREGPGAVVVCTRPGRDCYDLTGRALKVFYSPADRLTDLGVRDLPEFEDALRGYSPSEQVILVMLHGGGRQWLVLSLKTGAPPEAFKALAQAGVDVSNN